MLPTEFQFIWPSSFRREDFFLEIDQSDTRLAFGGLETIFVSGLSLSKKLLL
jgi:hypothetical protein